MKESNFKKRKCCKKLWSKLLAWTFKLLILLERKAIRSLSLNFEKISCIAVIQIFIFKRYNKDFLLDK